MNFLETIIKAALEAGTEILRIYDTDFEVELKSDNSPLTAADKASNAVIKKYLSKTNIPVLSEEDKETAFAERQNWKKLWIVDPLDGTKEFVNRNGEFTVNIALVENRVPKMGVIYVPVKKILYFGAKEYGSFMHENIEFSENYELNFSNKELKKLPLKRKTNIFTAVGSRSHLNDKTKAYFETLKQKHGKIETISKGSSLKFCMVVDGTADIYPRFGPTMEWDTAAGQAIVLNAGGRVTLNDEKTPLTYNRENLLNPEFIVFPT